MSTVDPLALLRKKVSESSQAEVAKAAGVSEPLISLVLAGERAIAGKLARFLGVRAQRQLVYVYERVGKRRTRTLT